LFSPPIALHSGILFGLSFPHPFINESRGIARTLLQSSLVALGFGMNLHEVLKAGRSGFIYTALGISFALLVGLALGKLLQVRGNSSILITAARRFAAAAPSPRLVPFFKPMKRKWRYPRHDFHFEFDRPADFSALGNTLHLRNRNFGLWAALAIHDTSSVVAPPRNTAASIANRHHCKTRPRALDRSARASDCSDRAQPLQNIPASGDSPSAHPISLFTGFL